MGARGPAPTPTPVLESRGSWRAKIRKSEPETKGELTPPRKLSKAAKKMWARLAGYVAGMNIAGEPDSLMLLALVEASVEHDECTAAIEKDGLFITLENGEVKDHPAAKRRDKAGAAIYRLAQQFGLSPASRARVQVQKAQEESPLAKLLTMDVG